MFSIALLLIAMTIIYTWLKWNYSYWKRNKVPGPEPNLFFGNLWSILSISENAGHVAANWYSAYPDEPYVGYYKIVSPAILLRSTELIKDVLTTNFDSFRNNAFNFSKHYDPLLSANPVVKRDDDWKEGRRMLTQIFSPNKLKMAVPVMDSVAADFVKFVQSYPARTELDAEELAVRFTTENVIKSLFSIEADCFNKDKESEFLVVPKIITPSVKTAVKGVGSIFLPNTIAENIPIPIIPFAVDRWFRNFVKATVKYRLNSSSRIDDLFEAFRQIQQKNGYEDSFLEGHSFTMFMDGTETSAVTLAYAFYELARNPHCQDKAYEEVARILSEHDGRITYETLKEMKYLESVLLEASRMHPTAFFLMRLCTKRYMLPKTTKQTEPIAVEPGTAVQIPIYAIHMDPKNYPDPEEFKPERFYDKEHLNKCTFLTFGAGNRACVGTQFAMLQMKVALAHIVLSFQIIPAPSQKPIVIDAWSVFAAVPKDGIQVIFEAR